MTRLWLRGINPLKITFSYLLSVIIKQPVHWGRPVAVSIEPNNSCNLRCPECPTGMNALTRTHGLMKPALFTKIEIGRAHV